MAERQVTIDGQARQLSKCFFVIATQNPIDSHGAYPLPEAQLDRFAIKLEIGYPDIDAQLSILNQKSRRQDVPGGGSDGNEENRLTNEVLLGIQDLVSECRITKDLQRYIVDLCEASRAHESVVLGVSPRGMLIWQQLAKAWAILNGRSYVIPNDVQAVARPVLRVRLVTRGASQGVVIEQLLATTPVPSYT
jgi:MoxR-like ATPase